MHCNKLLLGTLFIAALISICAAAPGTDEPVAAVAVNEKATNSPAEIENVEDPEKKKTTTTTTTTVEPETPTSTTTTTTTSTTQRPTTTATTSTTPPPPPPTTTVAPMPTPTPTPKPNPFPTPKIGTWNSTCIKIQLAAQLNFTYINKDSKNVTGLYNIPPEAIVDHDFCDSNITQSIQINWGPDSAKHSMMVQFNKVKNEVFMNMLYFILPLLSTDFPDAKANQTITLIHPLREFNMPSKMSYHCTRVQHLQLNETIAGGSLNGTVALSNVQIEAFRDPKAKDFATAKDCDGHGTSDVVPIAVGCALAALILIVLIGYICARRQSTQRGYMSF